MASINNSLFSFLITSTDNKIGERGATSLSESLKLNAALAELGLWSEYKRRHTNGIHHQFTLFLCIHKENDIGDTGATSLSESLKSNTTLTKLNLGGEDKRKKTHKWHPSAIHSFPFYSHQQITTFGTQEQNH